MWCPTPRPQGSRGAGLFDGRAASESRDRVRHEGGWPRGHGDHVVGQAWEVTRSGANYILEFGLHAAALGSRVWRQCHRRRCHQDDGDCCEPDSVFHELLHLESWVCADALAGIRYVYATRRSAFPCCVPSRMVNVAEFQETKKPDFCQIVVGNFPFVSCTSTLGDDMEGLIA